MAEPAPIDLTADADVPEHRERLADATQRLEDHVASSPIDTRQWMEELRAAVVELIDAIVMHIDETEGEGRLYDEIVAEAPRLSHSVDLLRREHVELLSGAAGLMARATVATDSVDAAGLVEGALGLGKQVERHQRRGLKLLYEFYDVDIGSAE